MGFLDKIKRKVETTLSDSREDEELIYEFITDEIESGLIRKGLYSKALANSKGNESQANALYMKYRLRSIKDAMKGESFKDFVAQKERDIRISQQLALSQELEKERIMADSEAAKKKLAEAKKKRKKEAEDKARQETIRLEKEAKADEEKRIEQEAKALIEKREAEVRVHREKIRLEEEANIKKVREEVMAAKEKVRLEKAKAKEVKRARALYENRLLDQKHNAILEAAVANRHKNIDNAKKKYLEEYEKADYEEKVRLENAEANRLKKLIENEKKRHVAMDEIAQEKKKIPPKEKIIIEAESVKQKKYSIDGITFKSKKDYEVYIAIRPLS